MESSFWFDAMNLGWSIVKGVKKVRSQLKYFPIILVIICLMT